MKRNVLLVFSALFCFTSNQKMLAQIIFDIPGATETYVTGINDSTDVCGYAVFPDVVKGFIHSGQFTYFVEYQPGVDTWLGGINNNGDVVGRYNITGLTTDYHCFVYHTTNSTTTEYPQMDGYELLSPNDISDNGWISGDLKDAAQRRVFRYHPAVGMETDFIIIGSDVWPTYGGHSINDFGELSAFFLANGDYFGVSFDANFNWSDLDVIDIADPYYSSSHKTKLMGSNALYAVVNFQTSKTSYIYDILADTAYEKLCIPKAAEVYALDINDDNYICGYYKDSSYVVHGFFQAKTAIDFLPSDNGWNFINTTSDCWTYNDWGNTHYDYDPYYTQNYFSSIDFPYMDGVQDFPDSSFFSWVDWVKTYGEEQCYNTDPNVGYVEQDWTAFHVWKKYRKNKFGGICWGMVTNAILAYENLSLLTQVYPDLTGLFDTELPASYDHSFCQVNVTPRCRQSHMRQLSSANWPRVLAGYQLEPHQVVDDIYFGLSDQAPVTNVLAIVLAGETVHGEHALMPYSMERDSASINRYRVYVYDPNRPLDNERYVLVEYSEVTSAYSYYFNGNWTTWSEKGLKYDEWIDNFNQPITISPIAFAPDGGDVRDGGNIVLTLPENPDISVTGDQGGSISVAGDSYSNTLVGSQTIFSMTGANEKPSSFLFNPGNVEATITASDDAQFSAYFLTDEGTIAFSRENALAGQMDGLAIQNEVCLYQNTSNTPVNVTAYLLADDDAGNSFGYTCTVHSIAPDQSVGLDIIDATHILITSSNGSATYDVNIRVHNDETGFWESNSNGISIGSEVTQQIIPDLFDDTFNGVLIETDANNDGVFEDSNHLDNEGMPDMMLSQTESNVAAFSGSGNFFVSNVGAGNLNWNILSSPSWITVNEGATGINHGPVSFSAEDNTGNTRQDWIIVQAALPSTDQDSVLVTQLGANGISELSPQSLMSMLPNPAKDIVRFTRKQLLGTESLHYDVFNVSGDQVASGNMNSNTLLFEVSDWESGVYTVRFVSPKNTFAMRLVVVK